MLVSVFLALFLPCAGMSAVFLVYLCLLWYATTSNNGTAAGTTNGEFQSAGKGSQGKGLSPSDLEKLPKITGKELVMGAECCAVCLEEIEANEPARLIPGCNHGFHLECADTWLSRHSVCPVCRSKLEPELFRAPEESSPC